MVGHNPMVVLKSEYVKSGRNASVVRMKMKNLLTDSPGEAVYRADDKFDVIQLERKEVSYSYFADPLYVFMDADYNPPLTRSCRSPCFRRPAPTSPSWCRKTSASPTSSIPTSPS